MSDLEDLGEIAEQTAFGTGRMPKGHHSHRPAARPRCGSPDHLEGKNIRISRKKNGRVRLLCRLCDRERRRKANPTAPPRIE